LGNDLIPPREKRKRNVCVCVCVETAAKEPTRNSQQFNRRRSAQYKTCLVLLQAVHSTREHLVNDNGMMKLLVYYNSFMNTLAAKYFSERVKI